MIKVVKKSTMACTVHEKTHHGMEPIPGLNRTGCGALTIAAAGTLAASGACTAVAVVVDPDCCAAATSIGAIGASALGAVTAGTAFVANSASGGAQSNVDEEFDLSEDSEVDFFDIAEWAKEAAEQKVMYLRLPGGNENFV